MTNDELKNQLKDIDLSLKDFAELVDISYSTVSKYGSSSPVPPWIVSWIDLYKQALQLRKLKTLLNELIST